MRFTVKDVKQSTIPETIGICADDPRFIKILNEAIQRLLTKGMWFGATVRFRICAINSCVTLPPQIASLEAVAVCGQPLRLRDQWFEFLENGFGIRCATNNFCLPEADYRGNFPSFDDIRGDNKKLRMICDLSQDVGKEVLLLGYDGNGNWIRTSQDGVIRDGEVVALAQSGGVTTTSYFSNLVGVQFLEDMDGQSWLYEYDNVTTDLRLLGHYQYYEKSPSYARYLIPMARSRIRGNDSDSGCHYTTIDAIGKVEYIPVRYDTDYVVIGCIPALKEMMIGINNAMNEADGTKANALILSAEGLAIRELNYELDHKQGGVQRGITVEGSSIGSACPVATLL